MGPPREGTELCRAAWANQLARPSPASPQFPSHNSCQGQVAQSSLASPSFTETHQFFIQSLNNLSRAYSVPCTQIPGQTLVLVEAFFCPLRNKQQPCSMLGIQQEEEVFPGFKELSLPRGRDGLICDSTQKGSTHLVNAPGGC